MKKSILLLSVLGIMFAGCNKDSDDELPQPTVYKLVSTDPTPRNVVLEEFTGIHCGFCPDGHAIAHQIEVDNPGRVVLINVHAGSYANPSPGEPDFRTAFGDPLASFGGVTGYPQGMVNRAPYGSSTALAMSRSSWTAAASQILGSGNSPVNLGVHSKWTADTRKLEIRVAAYFVEATTGSCFINVILLENGYVGYQANGGNDYVHNNIMRDMITGQWGEEITTTAAGTNFEKVYTYDLPATYDVENCDIAVFITGVEKKPVHTGIKVKANNGHTYILPQ